MLCSITLTHLVKVANGVKGIWLTVLEFEDQLAGSRATSIPSWEHKTHCRIDGLPVGLWDNALSLELPKKVREFLEKGDRRVTTKIS